MDLKKLWELQLLQNYAKKGIYARRGLIQTFIDGIWENLKKESRTDTFEQFGLDDNEQVATLQIGAIAHMMMFIEDLGAICTALKDGTTDYYHFLDSKDEKTELGNVVWKFFKSSESLSDDEILKILSYDISNLNFKNKEEKRFLEILIQDIIIKSRLFLKKVTVFKVTHHEIFRRYKHAGFPIILNVAIPEDLSDYKIYDFMSIAFISETDLTEKVSVLPFSKNVLTAYEILKQDIMEFLGQVIINKTESIVRGVEGIIPTSVSVFTKNLSKPELLILDSMWEEFEIKHPVSFQHSDPHTVANAKFFDWYVHPKNYSSPSFE